MSTQHLKGDKRELLGRKVKSLRKKNLIPANIYGKSIKSVAIQVNQKDFEKTYKEVGETTVLEIAVGKVTYPTLVHNLQKHAVTGDILHIDFLNVNLKEKVTTNVPVELEGVSPAEKAGLGSAVQQLNEIEIEALPMDIPEKFIVDISKLDAVDQAVFVKDIIFDKKKIEIKEDLEKIVVSVQALQKEEVIAPVVTEAAPTEAPAEGAVAAEVPKEEGAKEETPKA